MSNLVLFILHLNQYKIILVLFITLSLLSVQLSRISLIPLICTPTVLRLACENSSQMLGEVDQDAQVSGLREQVGVKVQLIACFLSQMQRGCGCLRPGIFF